MYEVELAYIPYFNNDFFEAPMILYFIKTVGMIFYSTLSLPGCRRANK